MQSKIYSFNKKRWNKRILEELIIENFNGSKNNNQVDYVILIGNSGSGKSIFLRNL